MAARSTWSKCLGLAACMGMMAATPVCGSTDDEWTCGVYTAGSPRPVVVTSESAWLCAGALAGNEDHRLVVVGTGRSMQPLYPSGTILVLREVAYSELRRGQTALYRNRHDRVVAHVLVAQARDGWRCRGLNNRLHDMEPVVPENLLGVVVAAFLPQEAGAIRVASVSARLRKVVFLDEAP